MEKLTPEQENYIGDLQYHERKVRKEFQKEHEEYIEVLNDRGKEGRKPISFDDYLWKQAEKQGGKK